MEKRAVGRVSSVAVVDPDSAEVAHDRDIVIEEGRITAVEPASQAGRGAGFDGTGLFAIPGLIDTHVHSLGFCTDRVPGPLDLIWIFRQHRRNLAAYLKSGITTIRDMGSSLEWIRSYSRRSERFEIEAPRILYAGPLFTVPGGYPYYVPNLPFPLRNVIGTLRIDLRERDGEAAVRKQVDRVVAGGAKCVKIMFQSAKYDESRTRIPVLGRSSIEALVRGAREHGLPSAIHHTFGNDLADLLDMDVPFTSLEHLTTDVDLGPREVERVAERGLTVSSTISTYGIVHHADEVEDLVRREPERFERKPARFLRNLVETVRRGGEPIRIMTRRYLETASGFMGRNLARLKEAGVPIVFATDSGIMSPAGCPLWELEDMIRAGMTRREALRAATSVAADAVGMSDLGRLRAGAIADLVLLRGNPLEDIRAIGRVAAVIRDGRLLVEPR